MKIILSLGSNYEAEQNIQMAEERLSSLFPVICFSRNLESAPYGESDQNLAPFINTVGVGETSLPYHVLVIVAKLLETYLGRTPEHKSSGRIDIDIDILQYGNMRLKADDWMRPYNVILLRELNVDM